MFSGEEGGLVVLFSKRGILFDLDIGAILIEIIKGKVLEDSGFYEVLRGFRGFWGWS